MAMSAAGRPPRLHGGSLADRVCATWTARYQALPEREDRAVLGDGHVEEVSGTFVVTGHASAGGEVGAAIDEQLATSELTPLKLVRAWKIGV